MATVTMSVLMTWRTLASHIWFAGAEFRNGMSNTGIRPWYRPWPSWFPTSMATRHAMPTGAIMEASSVSSSSSVASVTVMRPDPPRNDATPTIAYVPGSGSEQSSAMTQR